ncbi:hypothetical protein ACG92U_07225 [Leuconostoc citreum]
MSDSAEADGYCFEQGTDTYNPEKLVILKDMLQHTELAQTAEFKKQHYIFWV